MNLKTELKPEKREEVDELVENSSKVIAHYWPMTGFVHHNPLHDLISHPFEEAVDISKRFTGGKGYLQNRYYRKFLESGRITSSQLDDALKTVAGDDKLEICGQIITKFDVLRADMIEGISAPAKESLEAAISRSPNGLNIRSLAKSIFKKDYDLEKQDVIGKDITLIRWCDNELHKRLEWTMNREVIKWCEAFLDEGHSVWPMPNRREGFYAAWKFLAAKEWSPCGIAGSRKKIVALPDSPQEAILDHLDALGIPCELRQGYLSLVLTSLYGWASYINWRGSQKFELNSLEWQSFYPIDLVQYLAVRLFYERELVDQTCRRELDIPGRYDAVVSYVDDKLKESEPDLAKMASLSSAWRLSLLGKALGLSNAALEKAKTTELDQLLKWLDDFPKSAHGPVWLKAYEAGYLNSMVEKLRSSALKMKNDCDESIRPDVQANFCIDVRSEPYRRNLESVGNFETFGYGGFLDIPLRYKALGHHHLTNQNPGIVQPGNTIHEVARVDDRSKEERFHQGKGFLKTIKKMQHDMKSHVLTPYVKVEALGWIFGIPLIGRTLFPAAYGRWRKRIHDVIAPPVSTEVTVDRDEDEGVGFTIQDQANHVESVIRAMGLTTNKVARLVAMVGHKSTSDNNPYESAIDCGAVWGNSMEPNVRLFANMANKPYVRKYMSDCGIEIPKDTHFIAAEHNTTTDEVIIFDKEDIPDSHKKDVEVFVKGLQEATVKTALERCMRLPGSNDNPTAKVAVKEVKRRSSDWSETRPEWGLSQNAAYIIGSRKLTRDFNLESRSFLNSHDYRLDPTAAKLERIMNGPLAVGQWINGEHYFSATDPDVYGSGSKIYHNVVGRFAVMSGPQSDLRTGLAWQTIMSGGDNLYHEPMRMLVAVEAPQDRIFGIIQRSDLLTNLLDNEWMHLIAIDHESDDLMYRYIPKKGFESIPG